MTSDIERYTPPPSTQEIETIQQVASQISRTGMVPAAFRGKADDILAAALYGREIGLGMMASLQRIIVINGKPTLDAQGMAAMIRQHGHSLTGESDSQKATAIGKRGDTGDEMTVTFTIEMAQAAGLVKNGPWKQYPHAMLWARAVTQLARMLFPDVLSGFSYTPEEIGGDVSEEDIQPDIPVAAGPRPTRDNLTIVDDLVDGEPSNVVDAEVVEDEAPPPPVATLSRSFFAAWKATMKDIDADEETERAALEATYGDEAKGSDDKGERHSIKFLDPDKARALLKALKEGHGDRSADDMVLGFLNRGTALLAEREGDGDDAA